MPWGRAMGEILCPPSSSCGREAAESCWARVSSRERAESCRQNLGYMQPLALFWREGCSWSQERAGGIRPVPGAAPGLLPALLSSARAPGGLGGAGAEPCPGLPGAPHTARSRTAHSSDHQHPWDLVRPNPQLIPPGLQASSCTAPAPSLPFEAETETLPCQRGWHRGAPPAPCSAAAPRWGRAAASGGRGGRGGGGWGAPGLCRVGPWGPGAVLQGCP